MRNQMFVAAGLLAISVGSASGAPEEAPSPLVLSVTGYVEAYYQYAFARPDSRVVPLRYEPRHGSFAVYNAVVDVSAKVGAAHVRVALQAGDLPAVEYSSEPGGTAAWQHVQQAVAGVDLAGGLVVDAGLFLSPIGAESLASKDDWSWSRSNLFVALPAYHAGVRATRPLGAHWSGQLWIVNGWNDAIDRNRWKSTVAGVTYSEGATSATLLYAGGVERATGAPEGSAWRHLFDVVVTRRVTERLSVMAHADVGLESNEFGIDRWAGAALYAKLRATDAVELSARVDGLAESTPADASPIFYGVNYIGSATATVGYRAAANALLRLELRHDRAGAAIYEGERHQTTATAALVAWF